MNSRARKGRLAAKLYRRALIGKRLRQMQARLRFWTVFHPKGSARKAWKAP